MTGRSFARSRRRGVGFPRSRGQALVEFALVSPIFMFVMLAIFELGRAVFYAQVLDSAARDGARYAIVSGFESFCPSGPMPFGGTNNCDPNGDNVIQTVKDRAFGVTGLATDPPTSAHVKWCTATTYQADPPSSSCGDYDLATGEPVPCADWTGLGDGDNNRGQIVTVCISYRYQSLIGAFVPIPDFTVTGRATLVVNH